MRHSRSAARRAVTIIECVVAVLLSALVLGALQSLWSCSMRMAGRTVAVEDANRSLVLGLEWIGATLRRVRVDHQAPDVVVEGGGSTLTVTVLTDSIKNWQAPTRRVSIGLGPAAPGGLGRRLFRVSDDGSREELKGAMFQSVTFAWTAPEASNPWKSGVTVTLEAASGASGSRLVVTRIPVMLDLPPPAYPWPAPVKS